MSRCPWPEKTRFNSREAAESKIDRLQEAGEIGDDWSAYWCDSCQRWHIGHTPKGLDSRAGEHGTAPYRASMLKRHQQKTVVSRKRRRRG